MCIGGNAPLAQKESPSVAQWATDEALAAKKELPPPTHVLACLDLKTGKILQQRWIDSDVISSPVVTTFGGTVYRFNQADGAILSAR